MTTLNFLTSDLNFTDKLSVDQAYTDAKKFLSEEKHVTGITLFQHGLEVAYTLKEVTNDPVIFKVAILHHILKLPEGEQVLESLDITDEERALIRQIHNITELYIGRSFEDLSRLLDMIFEDLRLVILCTAHRVDEIRKLDRYSELDALQLARETLHGFTTLIGRLNMHVWRTELEDYSFKYLYPETYRQVDKLMDEFRDLDQMCLKHASSMIGKVLTEAGLEHELQGRIKGVYSTYRKMLLKDQTFGEIPDRLALRIILEREEDCYKALHLVNKHMEPVGGIIRDYIARPKENGYQSLHTVVYPMNGVTDRQMEVQIRTFDMHEECEQGIAAHSDYKKMNYSMQSPKGRTDILRNMAVLKQGVVNIDDFNKLLKKYLSEDQIIIFDSEGNTNFVDDQSTVLDFVCSNYGDKVKRLKEVKINGRRQNFGTYLSDGDTVEAVFGRTKNITKEWENYCTFPLNKKLVVSLL
ncbi:HD domain-containing protein [Candidatus Peregrinibacteria bacterium]|nr:HD domain-containing protein [Candidatus Peregrinibacteria bacterium]